MPAGSMTTTLNSSSAPGITEDTDELFARWQRDGDHAAREALVRRFMPLTRSLTRRYGRSSEPFEDLLQVASLGLLKAIDRLTPRAVTRSSPSRCPRSSARCVATSATPAGRSTCRAAHRSAR